MRSVVVLPTYDERENIEHFLPVLRAAMPGADIVVVDDNSPDGTGQLADALAAELGQIKVLHRAGKQGLGSAYRHGFQVAIDEGYDLIVSMDADFSHDPGALATLVEAIGAGADVVVGSRYVPGGRTEHWPWHRRMLSRWGNRYTSFVLRLPVRDCTSGFRVYRAAALASIEPSTTEAEGYGFLTELLRRAHRHGLRVDEHPIVFRDRERGTSKMSSRIIVESMLLVTRLAIGDLRTRRR